MVGGMGGRENLEGEIRVGRVFGGEGGVRMGGGLEESFRRPAKREQIFRITGGKVPKERGGGSSAEERTRCPRTEADNHQAR